jgi:hypothetical protein
MWLSLKNLLPAAIKQSQREHADSRFPADVIPAHGHVVLPATHLVRFLPPDQAGFGELNYAQGYSLSIPGSSWLNSFMPAVIRRLAEPTEPAKDPSFIAFFAIGL